MSDKGQSAPQDYPQAALLAQLLSRACRSVRNTKWEARLGSPPKRESTRFGAETAGFAWKNPAFLQK
jgi:hypothetical protein